MLIVGTAVVVVAAQLSGPGDAIEVALMLVAAVAFLLWGLVDRMPAEVFGLLVIVPVIVATGRSGHVELSLFLLSTMTLYTAWHLGSVTRAATIMMVAAASPWLVARLAAPDADVGWPAWSAACAFTYVLGRSQQRQRILIGELESARESLAEVAVAEERRRMARELHDLTGHTLAAVLLHVTGARHVLRRDVEEAERALVEAEAVGRSSMDQIRSAVTALRTSERGHGCAVGRVRRPVGAGRGVPQGRSAGQRRRVRFPDAARRTGRHRPAPHRP